MNLLTSMLPVLLTGVFVLMAGILISRGPQQNRRSALLEGMAWGGGFFIALCIEILTFPNI